MVFICVNQVALAEHIRILWHRSRIAVRTSVGHASSIYCVCQIRCLVIVVDAIGYIYMIVENLRNTVDSVWIVARLLSRIYYIRCILMQQYAISGYVYCRELYPVVLQTVEFCQLCILTKGFHHLSCCHVNGKNDRVPSLLVVVSTLGERTVEQHPGIFVWLSNSKSLVLIKNQKVVSVEGTVVVHVGTQSEAFNLNILKSWHHVNRCDTNLIERLGWIEHSIVVTLTAYNISTKNLPVCQFFLLFIIKIGGQLKTFAKTYTQS